MDYMTRIASSSCAATLFLSGAESPTKMSMARMSWAIIERNSKIRRYYIPQEGGKNIQKQKGRGAMFEGRFGVRTLLSVLDVCG